MLKGTTSSTGVAYGKIFILEDIESVSSEERKTSFDPEEELKRFQEAIQGSSRDLEKLREEVRVKIGEKEEKIFEAQSLILEDPALVEEVKRKITQEGLTASKAVKQTIIDLEQQFLSIEDKTIRQRIADIKDVGSRILKVLHKGKSDRMESISEPTILFTRELLPSQAAQLDPEKILAIVTEKGGINSHASIIARSLDIPAVVGVRGLLEKTGDSRTAIVDGHSGSVYLNPDPEMIEKYTKIKAREDAQKPVEETGITGGRIKTWDGCEVYLYANIGRLSELNKLKEYGVEGVGVLRSEFLLINRQSPPTVDEFTSNFTTILDFMSQLPVNIRLLDLGADKKFPFLSHSREANPNLGNRGIRFLLGNPHLLKSQIKGILHASSAGNARVLIPMVTTIQEIREVNRIIRRMEMELTEKEKNVKTQIPLGIMIETPASAILAEQLCMEVDFISIGSNDLTQYTLAADRENEQVQDIYNSLNPAVLRLINQCVQGARKAGAEISVCGEMAANIRAIPILLGMGITRLSVGVSRIPEVREIIKKVDVKKAKNLAKKALKTYDVIEVEKMVTRFLRKMEKNYKTS